MLRTRLPLGIATSFDLHVLGVPPAYILSHDQTLKFNNGVHKLCVLKYTTCTNYYLYKFTLSVYDKFIFDKYNRPRFSSNIYVSKSSTKLLKIFCIH